YLRAHHHKPARKSNPHSAGTTRQTFPRLRAMALFGRRSPEQAARLVTPASKNLHNSGNLWLFSRISEIDSDETIRGRPRPSRQRLEAGTQPNGDGLMLSGRPVNQIAHSKSEPLRNAQKSLDFGCRGSQADKDAGIELQIRQLIPDDPGQGQVERGQHFREVRPGVRHNSICPPSSTTRPTGMRKNSHTGSALRCRNLKTCILMHHHREWPRDVTLSRPTKNVVSIILKCRGH